ncbi:hypothetical protein KSZ_65400 [Dictyobacter formicarum]|uniref:Uncharacterized protein n=1 Tax=Dictyobacter formicarum TaxID=2778368 RepID=A0ABQ3VS64_9CHLR|nr:hypothetical protein KSZ_65400 [Dictyobacter formicarum]
MLQLIAEDTQTERSSGDGSPTAYTLFGESHELLGGRMAIVRWLLRPQQVEEGLNTCLGQGLGAREGFEDRQNRLSARISKDPSELGKEHHDQGLDLVLIGGRLIAQMRMQAD